MTTKNYAQIQPLIANCEVNNRTVRVVFQCPVTGEQTTASHSLRRQAGISNTVQRSVLYGIQNALSQTIRSMFGYNIFGRIAGDVARQGLSSAQRNMQNTLSQGEQQQAVLAAFQSVASRFYFDPQRNTWVSKAAEKELFSPFDLQLNNSPVRHNYDRQLLGRMLVEIAMADGILAPAEESWLLSFLDPSMGSIQSISQRPKITSAELNTASKGPVRQTLLMLAWALALADESFVSSEHQRLNAFSSGLGLTNTQKKSAEEAAQGYILEQAMLAAFQFGQDQYARTHIYELGSRLGIPQDKVSLAEAQFLRRKA
jgi:hypothetical protein